MLTDVQRKRLQELEFLVEETYASPDEAKEYNELVALDDKLIFVFGSNEKGIHGGGAAKVARFQHGAILGQGYGLQGDSWGIPTCALPTGMPNHEIELEKVAGYVTRSIDEWKQAPANWRFKVTQIGCGLAGWSAEQIVPLFLNAPNTCTFDTAWKPIFLALDGCDKRKYWGHVG